MGSGLLAFVFAIISTVRCNYFVLYSDGISSLAESLDDSAAGGIGLFSYKVFVDNEETSCIPYTQSQMKTFWDTPFRTAYGFAILAIMCTGISMILLYALACFGVRGEVLRLMGAMSIAGSICMAITFSAYGSFIMQPPYNATMSTDSGLAIGACIASLLTGVLICLSPPMEPRYGRDSAAR